MLILRFPDIHHRTYRYQYHVKWMVRKHRYSQREAELFVSRLIHEKFLEVGERVIRLTKKGFRLKVAEKIISQRIKDEDVQRLSGSDQRDSAGTEGDGHTGPHEERSEQEHLW